MGYMLMKVTQGLSALLLIGFFGFAVFKFGQVIVKGLTKEKK